VIQHLRPYAISGLNAALEMAVRRGVVVGNANNSGKKSALGQRQLAQILSEIADAGFSKAADAEAATVAEVDFVRVHFENLFFIEALLEFEREHGFRDLATPVTIGGKEKRACDLHGDGACALQVRAVAQVIPG